MFVPVPREMDAGTMLWNANPPLTPIIFYLIIFSKFSENNMAIKLTRRQQQFLSQFLDFYHEEEQPIHYPDLADRLGIGNVTAYEMLRLLEDQSSPLIYSTEMITATLLALEGLRGTAQFNELEKRLQRIGLPGEIGLSALGGISAALCMVENANRRASTFLLTNSGNYQTMISRLNAESRRHLGVFAREVAKIVGS
jgi:hypothetical protein